MVSNHVQRYLRSWSTLAFFLPACLILLAVAERAMTVGQNFWLSIWTDATAASAEDHEQLNNAMYLGIYFALGIVPVFVQVLPPVHPFPLHFPFVPCIFKIVHQNMLLNAVPLWPFFLWHIFILSCGPACALRPSNLAKVLCSLEVSWLCRKMQQMGVKFSMIDICQLQIESERMSSCNACYSSWSWPSVMQLLLSLPWIPSARFPWRMSWLERHGNRWSFHFESSENVGSHALCCERNWYHILDAIKEPNLYRCSHVIKVSNQAALLCRVGDC